MRHRKSKLISNRFTSWNKATMRSMAKNLFIYQSTKTTLHKAKVARTLVEKIISLTKKNTLAAKRDAFKILGSHDLVSLVFNEIGPRFANRQSGFTRIIPLGPRRGDNADVVILELTEIKKKEVKKHKKEAKAQEEAKGEITKEKPLEEKKPETAGDIAVKEKPPITKKPTKKFFGGLRNIFKKERRDSS